MAVKQVRFNASSVGNASPVFARGNAARGPDGASYDSGEIMYGRETVIFGAPEVEVIDSATGALQVKACGDDQDGNPRFEKRPSDI